MKLVPKPKPVAESCIHGRRLLCSFHGKGRLRCQTSKNIVGRIRPWPDGKGYQQKLWCTACPATGVRSANLTPRHGIRGLVMPDDAA